MEKIKNQESQINKPADAFDNKSDQKTDLKTSVEKPMESVVAPENKIQTKTEKNAAIPSQESGEKLFKIEDFTTNLTPKKILKLGTILILLILIVMALYVRFIRKTPINEPIRLLNAPTPSSFFYEKYKPSIYAEDANFKKLDEAVSVLFNEIKNIQLEEKEILPPSLDFQVEFK